jgi:hypothetical protein
MKIYVEAEKYIFVYLDRQIYVCIHIYIYIYLYGSYGPLYIYLYMVYIGTVVRSFRDKLFFYFSRYRISLCVPGWPGTRDPLASAS